MIYFTVILIAFMLIQFFLKEQRRKKQINDESRQSSTFDGLSTKQYADLYSLDEEEVKKDLKEAREAEEEAEAEEEVNDTLIAIFDKNTSFIAWYRETGHIFSSSNMELIAYINEHGVFTTSGNFLGFFIDGIFRDSDNMKPVAFIEGVSNLNPTPSRPGTPFFGSTPIGIATPVNPGSPVIGGSPLGHFGSKSWDDFIKN